MANVLGINLSALNLQESKVKLQEALAGSGRCFVVTPNPEIILAAHRDEELFYILNQADLSVADGFGLKVAGLFYQEQIPRVTGADLTVELLEIAARDKLRVAICNWRGGLSKSGDINKALATRHPNLDVLTLDLSRTASQKGFSDDVINKLREFSPQILFCTFGSPYQEKALYHSLLKLPETNVFLGCGGAFDFLTEKLKRAPRPLRQLGLEWLWRLYQQPKRLGRIINAVFIFTAKIIVARIFTRHRYRKNVACLLFKRDGEAIKVLIVERTDIRGHWQLPQGGTDGESIEVAGARELGEETAVKSFIPRGVFKDIYSYDFPTNNELLKHKFNYKGQSQSLFVAEFAGSDSEIKLNFWDHINWKWVEEDKLLSEIHESRRPGIEIFLEKFKSLNL